MSKTTFKNALMSYRAQKTENKKAAKVQKFENEDLSINDLVNLSSRKKQTFGNFTVYGQKYTKDVLQHLVNQYELSNYDNISIQEGVVIDAEIVQITDNILVASLGKMDIMLDLDKENICEPTVGNLIPIMLERINNTIVPSHSKAVKHNIRQGMLATQGTEVVWSAKVVKSIHGGYWCEVGGVQCFMPGSLASLVRLENFNSIVGEVLDVLVVGFEKGEIIISHRDYQKMQNVEASKSLKLGSCVTGKVTGIKSKGVFVELQDGVYGLMPHQSVVDANLEVGSTVEVYIRNFDDKQRVMLTQKFAEVNVWDFIDTVIKIGDVVDGVIQSENKTWVYVHICENVRGRLKKAKLPQTFQFVEGQHIAVAVSKIEKDTQNVTCILMQ